MNRKRVFTKRRRKVYENDFRSIHQNNISVYLIRPEPNQQLSFDTDGQDIFSSRFTKVVVDSGLGEFHVARQEKSSPESQPDFQGPLNIMDQVH